MPIRLTTNQVLCPQNTVIRVVLAALWSAGKFQDLVPGGSDLTPVLNISASAALPLFTYLFP